MVVHFTSEHAHACTGSGMGGTDTYSINSGSNTSITECGTCKNIFNGTSKRIFIPTKTTAEWTAMRANPPTGVIVSSCTTCTYIPTVMSADGTCTAPASCTNVTFKAW